MKVNKMYVCNSIIDVLVWLSRTVSSTECVHMVVIVERKELQVGLTQACYSNKRSITQQPHEKKIMPENHPPWRFPLSSTSGSLPSSPSPPAVWVSGIHLSVVSARE